MPTPPDTDHLQTLEGRELWLAGLWHVLDGSALDRASREALWATLEPLSLRLLAPPALPGDARRYPYAWVERRMRHPALAMCAR